jgi:hypothetical protein
MKPIHRSQIPAQMEATASVQTIIDPSFFSKLTSPVLVQCVAIVSKNIASGAALALPSRRKDAGGGPRGCAALSIPCEHANRQPTSGQFAGNGQPDNPSTNDAAVSHGAIKKVKTLRMLKRSLQYLGNQQC